MATRVDSQGMFEIQPRYDHQFGVHAPVASTFRCNGCGTQAPASPNAISVSCPTCGREMRPVAVSMVR